MVCRISPGLAVIDARTMQQAVAEFDEQGRTRLLKRYGFSRSSKFYLIHGQHLYDTKVLVAVAYRHATGRTLHHSKFSGGAQTQAIFRRLSRQDSSFARVFEDTLGELRNLANEYDRIPRAWTDLRELGFSKWIPLAKYADLNTGWLPGVYVIADSNRQPELTLRSSREAATKGFSARIRESDPGETRWTPAPAWHAIGAIAEFARDVPPLAGWRRHGTCPGEG
jgi:hypothetical protein